MKAFNTIVKILAALAAVAGAVYVVATYGDKIVAWAKKLWATLPQCPESVDVIDVQEAPEAEVTAESEASAAAEEPAAEAPAAEEAPAEEPAPQIPENEPVADEADFAE